MIDFFTSIGRFNFWSGNQVEIGYLRDYYCNKVAFFTGNRLVKVLVGQRRVGKSYILRQIAHKLIQNGVDPVNILYINKEYSEFDRLVNYEDLNQLINFHREQLKPQGRIYLFVDEIQNIDEWEKSVNAWSQDFTRDYEIFISGSNSKLLSGELATLLSGRYVQFLILPFSFTEYCGVHNLQKNKSSYIDYLQAGGLPELMHLPNDETKRHYVSAIKDTVLLRDIIQRNNIKDTKLLEDLFIYLVNNASNLLSVSNIIHFFESKKRKTNYETLSNYLRFIEEVFLVHRAERFNIKGKETIAGNCKYYINDLAFSNYLFTGFGYGIGYKLENLIYLELIRKGYVVYVGVLRDKEIDFVAKLGERTIYIQSAYILADKEIIRREYASLEAISDNFEKYVVSLDEVQLPTNEGIRHIQAWNLSDVI
jgi:uncharacterized protein